MRSAIFLRMLTKQKLPLYERFSELCRIAGAQAQSRIQFNFARELFAISQSNGLMNVRLRNAKKHNGN